MPKRAANAREPPKPDWNQPLNGIRNGKRDGKAGHGILLELGHRWRFISRYVRSPQVVGAVAPSSRALAVAVSAPFRDSKRPASVLEVGAGTGPVTRHLGTILGPEDRLDICEISPDFADILERDVLTERAFVSPVAEGRVRLLRQAVQDLPADSQYDFIISGLPLTSFEFPDVVEIFNVIRRSLKPGGVFSYFEYIALRRTSRMLAFGKRRTRIRDVSSFLAGNIRTHQFGHRTVVQNFPPAHVRHLRFN